MSVIDRRVRVDGGDVDGDAAVLPERDAGQPDDRLGDHPLGRGASRQRRDGRQVVLAQREGGRVVGGAVGQAAHAGGHPRAQAVADRGMPRRTSADRALTGASSSHATSRPSPRRRSERFAAARRHRVAGARFARSSPLLSHPPFLPHRARRRRIDPRWPWRRPVGKSSRRARHRRPSGPPDWRGSWSAVVGGQAIGEAVAGRSDAVQVVATVAAWLAWAAGALALTVPSVATLTAMRAIVPGAVLVGVATALFGAGTSALALVVPAAVAAVLAGAAETGRAYVQASAYGDESRFLLRPPLGYLAATAVSWAVWAAAIVAAPLAWAARAWVLAVVATVVAVDDDAAAASPLAPAQPALAGGRAGRPRRPRSRRPRRHRDAAAPGDRRRGSPASAVPMPPTSPVPRRGSSSPSRCATSCRWCSRPGPARRAGGRSRRGCCSSRRAAPVRCWPKRPAAVAARLTTGPAPRSGRDPRHLLGQIPPRCRSGEIPAQIGERGQAARPPPWTMVSVRS